MYVQCTTRVHGVYTVMHTAVYIVVHTTAVYTCTRPCTGRVHVDTTVYKAVYTGRIHVYTARTWPCTRVRCTWPKHGHNNNNNNNLICIAPECQTSEAMVTARVHSRIQDRVDGLVMGHAHGRVMTVYTARVPGGVTAVYTNTRPIYKTYRICNFLTNSCCGYIRKESKAP